MKRFNNFFCWIWPGSVFSSLFTNNDFSNIFLCVDFLFNPICLSPNIYIYIRWARLFIARSLYRRVEKSKLSSTLFLVCFDSYKTFSRLQLDLPFSIPFYRWLLTEESSLGLADLGQVTPEVQGTLLRLNEIVKQREIIQVDPTLDSMEKTEKVRQHQKYVELISKLIFLLDWSSGPWWMYDRRSRLRLCAARFPQHWIASWRPWYSSNYSQSPPVHISCITLVPGRRCKPTVRSVPGR